jgi:superfamily I DNA/RNA helicase
MDNNLHEEKYAAAKRKRQEHVDAVVASSARNKIVVAGPGTGKTYLFRKVLDGKKNTLTLTFVNALVEDLSLELFGLSEVRTLHGFARHQLEKIKGENIRVFPKLSAVIRQDAEPLLSGDVDFDALFHNRRDGDDNIEFYRKRRVYYGHYGFSDMVYAAVRFFEIHPDRIPSYSQVVIDEFQDFNALEVSLIEILASRSPVLLAGDDDQALYETLKSASAKHLRRRHDDPFSIYQSFALPYCSRCTRAIVESTNDVISGATRAGYLDDRIDKPFRYFEDAQKDRESEYNPQVVYSQVYPKQIPWFIQERVKEIAIEVRDKFAVLVISPTRTQCRQIAAALKEKGFENIHYIEKQESQEPTLLDGLNLLLEDRKCNLGWRVAAKSLLPETEFRHLLQQTAVSHNPPPFSEIMVKNQKKEVRTLLKALRSVRDGRRSADDDLISNLLNRLGIDALRLAEDSLRDQFNSSKQRQVDPGLRKVFIKVTTIPSSKGLAADYVFITHFDDRYFIKDKNKSEITDQDICSFLVALTRARKKAFLISSDTKKDPTFLKWINKARICTME